jgi:hypothetical protein
MTFPNQKKVMAVKIDATQTIVEITKLNPPKDSPIVPKPSVTIIMRPLPSII